MAAAVGRTGAGARARALEDGLRALVAATRLEERLAADPVHFARACPRPEDAEIAGLFAAVMAFGRVDLFSPVVEGLLQVAKAAGGPRAWIDSFDPARGLRELDGLRYRWVRPADLCLLSAGLSRACAGGARVERLLPAPAPGQGIRSSLVVFVDRLRDAILAAAPACGLPASRFEDLPAGLRRLLPSPRGGSACKRWNLYLRWMLRPEDGVDLGLWNVAPPSALVVPLDVHVHRAARLLGMTGRRTASWSTAEEITAALRAVDPDDPVRFDFALAHLGISGDCRGRRHDPSCSRCVLGRACAEGSARPPEPRDQPE